MDCLEKIRKIIKEKDLAHKSKVIARNELLELNRNEIKELLKATYTNEDINVLSDNMKIRTYGLEYCLSYDKERLKLSFDFVDYENDQICVFYCFYDLDGNYLDSFFD